MSDEQTELSIKEDYAFQLRYEEEKPYQNIKSAAPFHVVSSSLVRGKESFEKFSARIEEEILSWPKDTQLDVFPEYFARKTPPRQMLTFLEQLKLRLPAHFDHLVLVMGTVAFTFNGLYTNNAIIIDKRHTWFVPKTKVLEGDTRWGIVGGHNPGVIEFPKFKLGVLVCSDLWDIMLTYKLDHIGKADILAVPAWTATGTGNREFSKQDWHALARTRSTEYGVIVAVADHIDNFKYSDVANATIIFSPANRRKIFPTASIFQDSAAIQLLEVDQSVHRWRAKGLGQRDFLISPHVPL